MNQIGIEVSLNYTAYSLYTKSNYRPRIDTLRQVPWLWKIVLLTYSRDLLSSAAIPSIPAIEDHNFVSPLERLAQ